MTGFDASGHIAAGSYPAAFEIVGWSVTAGFDVNY
jgi:hypothetical protein